MISTSTFEQILDEYGKKRLAAKSAADAKKAYIEMIIPEIKAIENEIASISVAQAIAKIKGGAGDADYVEKIDFLRREKEKLLAKHGFTKADLEPVYECPHCKDTGYINDKMCACLKTKITDAMYDQMNLKEVLRQENFETFSLDYYSNSVPRGEAESPLSRAVSSRQKAMDFVANFARSEDNMLLTGNTGVGKTFLINCIVKELIDRNYFVIYMAATRFFKTLSEATFNKSSYGGTDTDFLESNFYSCDLLVIDDLGTELVNSFVISSLFHCIEERSRQKKHTIISTNLSLDQIRDTYGERIASRITSSYKYVKLLGDDIRIKKIRKI